MAREAPYLEVADDLRARIKGGEWSEGDRMPSRAQLAADYGVGRNVTQRAVDRLIAEGLLEGRAGSGTFVRGPRERGRMVRSSWHRGGDGGAAAPGEPRGLGDSVVQSNHTRSRVPASSRIAGRLGIAEGDLCVHTTYELHADRQLVQLSESWEPMAITGKTPVELPECGPLKGAGVVRRMLSLGIEVETAVEVPRPARATIAEAALLGIAAGDLLMQIERTYYATDGRAVETADITVPDVRWEIAYEIGMRHGG